MVFPYHLFDEGGDKRSHTAKADLILQEREEALSQDLSSHFHSLVQKMIDVEIMTAKEDTTQDRQVSTLDEHEIHKEGPTVDADVGDDVLSEREIQQDENRITDFCIAHVDDLDGKREEILQQLKQEFPVVFFC